MWAKCLVLMVLSMRIFQTGLNFLPPFREGITSDEHPYVKGDKVKVLIPFIE